MKLKSLLIGSAAVMAAATGARAADAIVVPEPEPMEYVRVCDVYGAGFFYIPGTETCLQISGYVFYQVGATSDDGVNDSPNYHGFDPDEYDKFLRARINFDARSETEWGTLRSYIRVQSNSTNVIPNQDPGVNIDQAWLSLGGFRTGYSESAWTSTPNGGDSGWGSHSWGGLEYGNDQRTFIQYNFTGGNGLFATLSLESDDYDIDPNYVPDVVGKIGVTQGWGTLWLTGAYDENTSEITFTDDDAFAVSAGAHINMGAAGANSLRVLGFYASDPNSYWEASQWSVMASYYHQFTPEFGASVGGQYLADLYYGGDDFSDDNAWLAELNLVWTPVTNFEVRSEIVYTKVEDLDGSVSGFLRFTRYF
ncbi:porin-like protein [Mesorhizobium sp. J18]|uniref:porin n=1 Tax=Mesorhizobium sp. J18 TaxID=935263 RepID=UPI00119B8971|nr:porin [Mesorhizobium sp. J18]TWG99362.1 porin-like protein [Mesorhizobium sp. J18]